MAASCLVEFQRTDFGPIIQSDGPNGGLINNLAHYCDAHRSCDKDGNRVVEHFEKKSLFPTLRCEVGGISIDIRESPIRRFKRSLAPRPRCGVENSLSLILAVGAANMPRPHTCPTEQHPSAWNLLAAIEAN